MEVGFFVRFLVFRDLPGLENLFSGLVDQLTEGGNPSLSIP